MSAWDTMPPDELIALANEWLAGEGGRIAADLLDYGPRRNDEAARAFGKLERRLAEGAMKRAEASTITVLGRTVAMPSVVAFLAEHWTIRCPDPTHPPLGKLVTYQGRICPTRYRPAGLKVAHDFDSGVLCDRLQALGADAGDDRGYSFLADVPITYADTSAATAYVRFACPYCPTWHYAQWRADNGMLAQSVSLLREVKPPESRINPTRTADVPLSVLEALVAKRSNRSR